jgi:hypothetical protein
MIAYIVILVIGIIALLIMGRSVLLGRKSSAWPTVGGTILQSGIETVQSTDDDGSTSTTYGVNLQYQFSVAGQQYQGTRRTFTEMRTSSFRRTQKILEGFPQGGSVTVYYDPEDPSSCVLEPGVNAAIYIFLAFAAILVLVGAAGLLGLFG